MVVNSGRGGWGRKREAPFLSSYSTFPLFHQPLTRPWEHSRCDVRPPLIFEGSNRTHPRQRIRCGAPELIPRLECAKKASRLGPVTRRSRLVTSSRETVSKKIFCLKEKIDQNINIWVKILGEILRLMYLVSHLVSSRDFLSRDKLDETVSCLVSSRDFRLVAGPIPAPVLSERAAVGGWVFPRQDRRRCCTTHIQ